MGTARPPVAPNEKTHDFKRSYTISKDRGDF